MLIKKIAIKNFRQYKNVELKFSTDREKNVTVILGENGYGKTTLVRAFLWCLFRENGFINQSLLNDEIGQSMEVNSDKTVSVELDLQHAGFNYRITTKEVYRKTMDGTITIIKKAKTSVIRDGVPIPEELVDIEITKKILKKEVKDYFFYDGENNKIEAASKRGSLKDAVSQMMGIKKIETLASYFNTNSKISVPYSLKKKISGDVLELEPLNTRLNSFLDAKQMNLKKIKDNEKEIDELDELINEKEALISANKDVEEDQNKKIKLIKLIAEDQSKIDGDLASMVKSLNDKRTSSLLRILYAKCFDKYNIEDFIDQSSFGSKESLSHISEEAVDQLIERGRCLCGAIITNGNDAYKHLIESKEHMEPHDYGKYLSDFISVENSNKIHAQSVAEDAIYATNKLLNRIESIENNRDVLTDIEEKIKNRPDVGIYQRELRDLLNHKNQLIGTNKHIENNILPDLEFNIRKIEKEIYDLASKTKDNELIKKCIEYAEFIAQTCANKIKKSQKDTRELLEQEVNRIFKEMYHGDRTLSIDMNFDITTYTNNRNLDNSTGTETVKNFSFVAGLLNLIKKQIIKDDMVTEQNDIQEIYPLIMDAPFSDTDDEHIQNICSVLPNCCDQLCIIVIKKDYNIAKNVIDNKVGKLYQIVKHSETYDTIEEVEF